MLWADGFVGHSDVMNMVRSPFIFLPCSLLLDEETQQVIVSFDWENPATRISGACERPKMRLFID